METSREVFPDRASLHNFSLAAEDSGENRGLLDEGISTIVRCATSKRLQWGEDTEGMAVNGLSEHWFMLSAAWRTMEKSRSSLSFWNLLSINSSVSLTN